MIILFFIIVNIFLSNYDKILSKKFHILADIQTGADGMDVKNNPVFIRSRCVFSNSLPYSAAPSVQRTHTIR